MSCGSTLLFRRDCHDGEQKSEWAKKKKGDCFLSFESKPQGSHQINLKLDETNEEDGEKVNAPQESQSTASMKKGTSIGRGYQLQYLLQRVLPPHPIVFWNSEKKYSEWNDEESSLKDSQRGNGVATPPSPAALLHQLQHWHEPRTCSLPWGVIHTHTTSEVDYRKRLSTERRHKTEKRKRKRSLYGSLFSTFQPSCLKEEGDTNKREVRMPLPALGQRRLQEHQIKKEEDLCKRQLKGTTALPLTRMAACLPFSYSPLAVNQNVPFSTMEFLFQIYGRLQAVKKPLSAEVCSAHTRSRLHQSTSHHACNMIPTWCEGRHIEGNHRCTIPSEWEEKEDPWMSARVTRTEEEGEAQKRCLPRPISLPSPPLFPVMSAPCSLPYNQVLGVYFSPWGYTPSYSSAALSNSFSHFPFLLSDERSATQTCTKNWRKDLLQVPIQRSNEIVEEDLGTNHLCKDHKTSYKVEMELSDQGGDEEEKKGSKKAMEEGARKEKHWIHTPPPRYLMHQTYVVYQDQDAYREVDVAPASCLIRMKEHTKTRTPAKGNKVIPFSISVFDDDVRGSHVFQPDDKGEEGEREEKPMDGRSGSNVYPSSSLEEDLQQCLADVVVERCLCVPSSVSCLPSFSSPCKNTVGSTSLSYAQASCTEARETDRHSEGCALERSAFYAARFPLWIALQQTENALKVLVAQHRSPLPRRRRLSEHSNSKETTSLWGDDATATHSQDPPPPPHHRIWNGEVWVVEEDSSLCHGLETIYQRTVRDVFSSSSLTDCDPSDNENSESVESVLEAMQAPSNVRMTSCVPLDHPAVSHEGMMMAIPRAWTASFWRAEPRRNQLCYIPFHYRPITTSRQQETVTDEITLPTMGTTSAGGNLLRRDNSLPKKENNEDEQAWPNKVEEPQEEDVRNIVPKKKEEERDAPFSLLHDGYYGAWHVIMTRKWIITPVEHYLLQSSSSTPLLLPQRSQRSPSSLTPATSPALGSLRAPLCHPQYQRNRPQTLTAWSEGRSTPPSTSSLSPGRFRQFCARKGKTLPPYDALTGQPLGPFLSSLLRPPPLFSSMPGASGSSSLRSVLSASVNENTKGGNEVETPLQSFTPSTSDAATPFLFSTRYGAHPCWVPLSLSSWASSLALSTALTSLSSCGVAHPEKEGRSPPSSDGVALPTTTQTPAGISSFSSSSRKVEVFDSFRESRPALSSQRQWESAPTPTSLQSCPPRFLYLTPTWKPKKSGRDMEEEMIALGDDHKAEKRSARERKDKERGHHCSDVLHYFSLSPSHHHELVSSPPSLSSSLMITTHRSPHVSCMESAMVPLPYTITITGFLLSDPPRWFSHAIRRDWYRTPAAAAAHFSCAPSSPSDGNFVTEEEKKPLPNGFLQQDVCGTTIEEEDVMKAIQGLLRYYPLLPVEKERGEGWSSSSPTPCTTDRGWTSKCGGASFQALPAEAVSPPFVWSETFTMEVLMEEEGSEEVEERRETPQAEESPRRIPATAACAPSPSLTSRSSEGSTVVHFGASLPRLVWRRLRIPPEKALQLNYLFSVGSKKELQALLSHSDEKKATAVKLSPVDGSEKEPRVEQRNTRRRKKGKEMVKKEMTAENLLVDLTNRICVVEFRAALQWMTYVETRREMGSSAYIPRKEEDKNDHKKQRTTTEERNRFTGDKSSGSSSFPPRPSALTSSPASLEFGPFHILLPPCPSSSGVRESFALHSPEEVGWALSQQWRQATYHPLRSWGLFEYESFLKAALLACGRPVACSFPSCAPIVAEDTKIPTSSLHCHATSFQDASCSDRASPRPPATWTVGPLKKGKANLRGRGGISQRYTIPLGQHEEPTAFMFSDMGEKEAVTKRDGHEDEEEDQARKGLPTTRAPTEWEKGRMANDAHDKKREAGKKQRRKGDHKAKTTTLRSVFERTTSENAGHPSLPPCDAHHMEKEEQKWRSPNTNNGIQELLPTSLSLCFPSPSTEEQGWDYRFPWLSSPSLQDTTMEKKGTDYRAWRTDSVPASHSLFFRLQSASLERWEHQWEKWMRYLQAFQEEDEAIRQVVQRITLRTRRSGAAPRALSTPATTTGYHHKGIGKGDEYAHVHTTKKVKAVETYFHGEKPTEREPIEYSEEEEEDKRDLHESQMESMFVPMNTEECSFSSFWMTGIDNNDRDTHRAMPNAGIDPLADFVQTPSSSRSSRTDANVGKGPDHDAFETELPFLSKAYRRLFFTSPPPFDCVAHFPTDGSCTRDSPGSLFHTTPSTPSSSFQSPTNFCASCIHSTDLHLLVFQIPQEKLYCNASNLHHVSFSPDKQRTPN